jgi:hypothetical protein
MKTKTTILLILMIFILTFVPITVYAGNTNLAPIPNAWGGYSQTGYLHYMTGPQIIFLDTTFTHNGHPSIRIERHVEGIDMNHARECDGTRYNVKAGDHIVAKCWIKTGASGYGDTNIYSGARTGIDLYHDSYNLGGEGVSLPLSDADWYVHWGSNWTLRTIDFVVPSDYFTYDYNTEQTISPVQANSFCFWIQVWSSTYGATDPGLAWFADAELYINPGGIPSSEAPSIEIWTNKATYARGKTMSVYLQAFNPGPATTVKIIAKIGLAGGGTYGLWTIWTGTVPASYNSGVKFWKSFPIPYSTAVGTYTWIAELRNPTTNALIDSDTWTWTLT